MTDIPRAPLLLGLAGLLPFLWAAAGIVFPPASDFTVRFLGSRFSASFILISYGTVILCFMSGVLWGFATKESDWKPYALSTLPALWAFIMIGGGESSATLSVMAGFLFLFACDLQFSRWGLAPDWWIPLRSLLTAIVLACLAIGWLS